MGKLNLKETPEERAERRWRKAKKAERRSHPTSHLHRHRQDSEGARGSKRRQTDGNEEPPSSNSGWEDDWGWVPLDSSSKTDPDQLRAEVEERLFREKLFDAMEDDYDHRLDGIEAQLNDYGHVPHRWKAAAAEDHHLFDHPTVNPNEMADEEYAEWIREGMWRRTHKAEVEERERKQAERKARKEKERKAKEEAARLEREREAQRQVKREFKEGRRRREAWDYYETRWKAHTNAEPPDIPLKFRDVPWPVFSVPTTTEDLTTERICSFLLYGLDMDRDATLGSKTRKERIREALLRWHPDKFEGKMGSRLDKREREVVLDGVGIVARCLNELMAT
ncbi:hypothetical protein K439DRAFT_1653375 [Ramaria rubella]|nr:hypothetical protein K439DRAFT_1653375 [Ramaria rubella]